MTMQGGGKEDDSASAAPPEGKKRRRDDGEDSSSRRSPSHGPPSYKYDGIGNDNDHDHYFVRFSCIFQRHIVHCRHRRRVDRVDGHDEVMRSFPFLDEAMPPASPPCR
jgi:hypothetical protein